jgi:3'(2'), 5'-bisphosphate nucleotidase
MTDSPSEFASALAEIAHQAGRLILGFFRTGAAVRRKSDDSPVTAADEQAELLILERLSALAPNLPVIAEERMERSGAVDPGRRFFLVDPLDGTEEFVNGRDEFTVNIALIENGFAVCGALIAPAKNRAFVGEKGKGAYELVASPERALDFQQARSIRARKTPAEGLTVLVSRTHQVEESKTYEGHGIARALPVASSLKFGILAAGEGDLYPRHGPTSEWDTAAGQAILEAAGGSMKTIDGSVFRYGKVEAGFRNPGFIARGLL